MSVKPFVLCILDGWGEGPPSAGNAIFNAKTPTWDRLRSLYPHMALQASQEAVGLPPGQMGNSEVGHTTIGAGRICPQDLPQINQAFSSGLIFSSPVLKELMTHLQETGGACHIMGLLSDGGVHALDSHLYQMARFLSQAGISVWIHGFLDGRDTPPQSALDFFKKGEDLLQAHPLIKWGTLGGRYYAMDRDCRWERTKSAYTQIADPHNPVDQPAQHITSCWSRGVNDEFVPPFSISTYPGLRPHDSLIIMNFRTDRIRQLLRSFFDPTITWAFKKIKNPSACLTSIGSDFDAWIQPLYKKQPLDHTLGDVISHAKLPQLRLAETEKYAHVTYFFNGGRETPLPGEERLLIPSPLVATYDISPAMSAPQITQELLKVLSQDLYPFIVVNYANPDMVGHTGHLGATQAAIEVVDHCLEQITQAVLARKGGLLITADHGNAECMMQAGPAGIIPHTAHTCHTVPCLFVGPPAKIRDCFLKGGGGLQDIAPTVLSILQLPIPQEMTGRPLFQLCHEVE